MLDKIFGRIFGNKQSRDMRKLLPLVEEVNAFAEDYQSLTDDELAAKTDEFRGRYADGESLDDLLPEAFAAVKETCRRHVGKTWNVAGNDLTWEMVQFDVQIAGGICLHRGCISEMATGEGKTLVAIMPLYLRALAGRGVHLITVNDYLARRDSEWMTPIFASLGMTMGCLDKTEPSTPERRAQYECDITYGTNHEFGFDYLRDNMAQMPDQIVQRRGHFFAIVDEVDNILIDEARTPLIISGPVDRSTHRYDEIKPLVMDLVRRQNELVTKLVTEAEEMLAKDPTSWDAGVNLLRAQRGYPKHKRFQKVRQEAGVQTLIEKAELEFIARKKMGEVDEALYYALDEKGSQIDLTEQGRNAISPTNPRLWEMPDIVESIGAIDAGDFEVIELTENRKALLDGKADQRAKAKQPDGSYKIPRLDSVMEIPAELIVRVVPGTEVPVEERDVIKNMLRQETSAQSEKLHNISQLLRAYTLYEKDVQYVVMDNKVVIVDEFTGRMMTGRRWSDGLHQAVECKEGVTIEPETQTLATVTLQNYFRMYETLSGMTGTAETEAAEFTHTYKMDVVVVPPNRPCIRKDLNDVIYKTKREKYKAILDEVQRVHAEGLPVLVGTVNVEVSELLSKMFQREGIPHSVLNAKNHAREAEIVKLAGQPGAVTIATNMAGRGTDIKLHADVIRRNEKGEATGGLQVIGTERHDARRIDRQLRGRSGRQGDPGRTIFFLSLEDDLMRLFGSERIARVMDRLGMQEGEEITHSFVTRAIEGAQKRIEQRNFEQRKRTLDYDNVMNKQREAIYGLRREALFAEDIRPIILPVIYDAIQNEIAEYGDPARLSDDWDMDGLLAHLNRVCPYADFSALRDKMSGLGVEPFMEAIVPLIEEGYDRKKAQLDQLDDDLINRLGRYVLLRHIDSNWIDHLLAVDDLRDNVGWRGMAQMDPLVEYQREASKLFDELMNRVHKEVLEHFFVTQPTVQGEQQEQDVRVQAMEARQATLEETLPELQHPGALGDDDGLDADGRPVAPPQAEQAPRQRPVRVQQRAGRNDPCPCGSGKKFKNCHGKNED